MTDEAKTYKSAAAFRKTLEAAESSILVAEISWATPPLRTAGCLKTPESIALLFLGFEMRPNGLFCTRTSANFVRES
jgi:hypothetical protein